MTNQPPKTLADCAHLVNEAVAALLQSNLTDEQKQHVGTLANGYLYASRVAESIGKTVKEIDERVRQLEVSAAEPSNDLN